MMNHVHLFLMQLKLRRRKSKVEEGILWMIKIDGFILGKRDIGKYKTQK